MSGIVGTKSLSRELLVDVSVSLVVRVVTAPRVVRVRATDQQPPVLSLGQYSNVVLTIILEKKKMFHVRKTLRIMSQCLLKGRSYTTSKLKREV